MITNAVVTMVPVVDQVADIRDLVANGKALVWDKRYGEIAVWVGVFACLIGLVPTLGSLAKGVIKLVWKNADDVGRILIYINKALFKVGKPLNGYRFLKKLADEVPGYVGFATQKFNELMDMVSEKIALARRLMPTKVAEAQAAILAVRAMANEKFAEVAKLIRDKIMRGLARFATPAHSVLPSQSIIIRRAVKAVVEAGPFKSWQKTMTREGFDESALELGAKQIDEAAARRMTDIELSKYKWRDELLNDPDLPDSIREYANSQPERFLKAMTTFGDQPTYKTFQPGDRMYRVIGKDGDHTGGFWSPSRPPSSEAEWRSRDAVLNDWNLGGAYIIVEVPPPPAVLVGSIGPQNVGQKYSDKSDFYLEGGGTQYFVPKYPAVDGGQIIEYWHTEWNAPTSALRAMRNAGKIDECDL